MRKTVSFYHLLAIISAFSISLFLPGALKAQDDIFAGKKVGIYFSKRGFDFDGNYNLHLTQFLKTHRGHDAKISDLKSETLIALGQKMTSQFSGTTGADSAFFLNENPVLGREFIRAYHAGNDTLDSLGVNFSSTDLILMVSPIVLGSRKNPVVFVRSNRIINRQEIVKNGRIKFTVWDTRSRLPIAWAEACADEKETSMRMVDFHFYPGSSPTGKFLGLLFTQVYRNLKDGKVSNCGNLD